MRIGATKAPNRSLIEEIGWLGKHGFSHIDVDLSALDAMGGKSAISTVRNALADNELDVVVQSPGYIPVASPTESTRRDALEDLTRSMEMAGELGSPLLSVRFRFQSPDYSTEEIIRWHAEARGSLAAQAKEFGTTIVIETLSHGGHCQLENIDLLMVQVPSLYFHLSTRHARAEGDHGRFAAYVKRLGPRIRHVHLSDSEGMENQHLPLASAFRSRINWPECIKLLRSTGYDETITLNVFSPEREYLVLSRELLRKWWDAAA